MKKISPRTLQRTQGERGKLFSPNNGIFSLSDAANGKKPSLWGTVHQGKLQSQKREVLYLLTPCSDHFKFGCSSYKKETTRETREVTGEKQPGGGERQGNIQNKEKWALLLGSDFFIDNYIGGGLTTIFGNTGDSPTQKKPKKQV